MTHMETMTFINLIGNDSTSVCPKCGSNNCVDFDTPYFSKCMDCGFESMASEDQERALDAWTNGYEDIEDKAKHEGIDGFTHDELADLWWYEVGMCGCTEMGMQPEEIDEFWDTHPDDLKEEVHMMWSRIKQFVQKGAKQ